MSSEIWNIGHYNRNEIGTKEYKIGYLCCSVEYLNFDKLNDICSQMINDFNSVEQDQNEYYIEMDSIENEYNAFKTDINKKIQEILNRIYALGKKEQNGTITEDERAELAEAKKELGELYRESNRQMGEANSKRSKALNNIQEIFGNKESLAKEYGDAAVEEGSITAKFNENEGSNVAKKAKKVLKEKGSETSAIGNKLLSILGRSSTINKK